MPPVGFEPTISAGERPKTYALDRAAIGTGQCSDTPSISLDIYTVLLFMCQTHFFSYHNETDDV